MQLSVEYRLANILIRVPDAASADEIQAADRRAQELYQQLQQGADFAQLAIASSASETARPRAGPRRPAARCAPRQSSTATACSWCPRPTHRA